MRSEKPTVARQSIQALKYIDCMPFHYVHNQWWEIVFFLKKTKTKTNEKPGSHWQMFLQHWPRWLQLLGHTLLPTQLALEHLSLTVHSSPAPPTTSQHQRLHTPLTSLPSSHGVPINWKPAAKHRASVEHVYTHQGTLPTSLPYSNDTTLTSTVQILPSTLQLLSPRMLTGVGCGVVGAVVNVYIATKNNTIQHTHTHTHTHHITVTYHIVTITIIWLSCCLQTCWRTKSIVCCQYFFKFFFVFSKSSNNDNETYQHNYLDHKYFAFPMLDIVYKIHNIDTIWKKKQNF